MRWNRIADDSLDRSWNRNWKWNCDLEYAPQAHGQEWQERQDSDYECAARDFQLSPNYVSNSYEIAKDFWVKEVSGKGHGCVPDTFAARRWRNFQKICNRNTQRWPDVLRCRIRYTRMWYTLYVRYMLYAVCHQGPPIRSHLKISENNCGSRLSSLTRCPKQILHCKERSKV